MPFYFAYGGNTNPNHIARSYPNIKVIGVFILKNFELVSRQIPTNANKNTTCKENVFYDVQDHNEQQVEGVVYQINQHELEAFDKQEQLNIIYERQAITLYDKNDEKHCLKAWIYKMIDQTQPLAEPSQRYANVVNVGYQHHQINNHIRTS
jgi:gamma-glutamylcyclotransferase (GGCT)/AIG2-like uncharacterized protein YtfP